ncbi:glycosyltransferase family 2 protein [Aeromonas veronii]
MTPSPLISVIIKTYNEEAGIADTIASIRSALADYSHQIIVADSLSTDRTQAIACQLGVTVVSLTDPADRCCGVGPQLGYLFSEGEFLLLLDGDMKLEPEFVPAALAHMHSHPDCGGVAGRAEMDDAHSYEFKSRKQRINQIYPLGESRWLCGGGLFRRSAIEQIGYLTNRNLHGYEEAELGIRLRQAGYRLERLDVPFFFHTSHTMDSLALIRYRWRMGYLFASGELVRSAWGQPYFREVLLVIRSELLFGLYLLTLLFCVLLFVAGLPFWLPLLALTPLCGFIALKWLKNRSLQDALRSVMNLSIYAAGLVRGLLLPQHSAREAPAHRLIQESLP